MRVAFSKRGFVLVEAVLVFIIAAIVVGIFLIAMRPGRHLADLNNADRSAEVQSILSAIGAYQNDHSGSLPSGIPANVPRIIGSGKSQANLCAALVSKYIESLPFDPTATLAHFVSCADYNTGYTVVSSGGHVTVAAPSAEAGETISATR